MLNAYSIHIIIKLAHFNQKLSNLKLGMHAIHNHNQSHLKKELFMFNNLLKIN